MAEAATERFRGSRLPVYIAAALCVIGAIFVIYLERAPHPVVQDTPATDEAKAYVKNLRLSDVTMKATQSYTLANLVEVEGNIENTGDRAVQTVEVYCYFYDAYGQMVYRPRLAIVTTAMGGLKPGEMKAFRLPFDDLPASWNQMMPKMQVAGIKFKN